MASTDDQQQAQARQQSNLAFAFKLAGLEGARRRAMEVFYTFCRVADDIVDEPGDDTAKRAALDAWRKSIRGYFEAPGGAQPHDALARELAGVVYAYEVPMAPLLAIIDGCAMDIGGRAYATAAELHEYCYGVASAVGLVSIRIFGCRQALSEEFAVALGYALQFTNILRDVVEDYHELGRIYLPRDEMAACGVAPEDLADPGRNPNCVRLFRLQYFRAKHYFNKARRLVALEDREALKAAFVMGAFYEAILEKIKTRNFQITRRRIRLSKWKKIRLLQRTLREIDQPMTPLARPRRVAVIGGGVAGMAAAIEATLAGHTVTLLESKPVLGGRTGSFHHAGTGREIDYGHHAMFGCYHAFLRLADTLGLREKLEAAPRLEVPYRSPGGRASLLRAWALPAPMHLLGALAGFSEIGWRDRLAIVRFGLALRMGKRPRRNETAADWLARLGQTPGALRALWDPFCIAALNEPLASADAALLAETVRRTLFGGVADAAILTSRVGLSQLFDPEVSLFLRAVGGELRLRAPVQSMEFSDTAVSSIDLADGGAVRADTYILATPWKTAARLLPETSPLAASLRRIQGAPILNVHLFVDKPLMREPFAGLLDSPLQWVFDRTEKTTPPGQRHYAITLSCPGDWMKLFSTEIVARTRTELARFFPDAETMAVLDSLVCKCPDATFAARPETAPLRPGPRTPWNNLLLAGDWTDTGLPATIEGAAQSGQAAAGAIA